MFEYTLKISELRKSANVRVHAKNIFRRFYIIENIRPRKQKLDFKLEGKRHFEVARFFYIKTFFAKITWCAEFATFRWENWLLTASPTPLTMQFIHVYVVNMEWGKTNTEKYTVVHTSRKVVRMTLMPYLDWEFYDLKR